MCEFVGGFCFSNKMSKVFINFLLQINSNKKALFTNTHGSFSIAKKEHIAIMTMYSLFSPKIEAVLTSILNGIMESLPYKVISAV